MKDDGIQGLSSEQIEALYVLPAKPKYITDTILELGTKPEIGIVNQLNGWGEGGARQWDFMG